MADAPQTLRRRQWMVFGGGLALIVIAIVGTDLLSGSAPPSAAEAPARPLVSVVESAPGAFAAEIRVQAVAEPRNDLTVRAMVSAPVAEISDNLLPGARVTAGDLLIRLETHALEAQLANARNRLAAADLTLATEEAEAARARDAWRRSGETGAPPPLRARAPQLAAARAEREAAEAEAEDVRQSMRYANITAPFDAVVVERAVSPGEMVAAGDVLARLRQDSVLDIAVQLSERERALLGDDLAAISARLVDRATGRSHPAEVRALGGVIDPATRLDTLYLTHRRADEDAGAEALPAGAVVDAVFEGPRTGPLHRAPESALTRDGLIWTVDADERLRSLPATLAFSRNGEAYLVIAGAGEQPLRIARSPVTSFVDGALVTARAPADQLTD